MPLERFARPLDQQDFNLVRGAMQQDNVDGQRWTRMIVTIAFRFIGCHVSRADSGSSHLAIEDVEIIRGK